MAGTSPAMTKMDHLRAYLENFDTFPVILSALSDRMFSSKLGLILDSLIG
jgi:hypothetical protein